MSENDAETWNILILVQKETAQLQSRKASHREAGHWKHVGAILVSDEETKASNAVRCLGARVAHRIT